MSLVLEPLPHLLFRDWARASALDSAREVSRSSAYGSELSTNITAKESAVCLGYVPGSRTVFGNVQPDAVLVKRVLIRIEPLQVSAAFWWCLEAIIHGRVLLMAEDNALAGPTLSATFATLCALGFLFIAWGLLVEGAARGRRDGRTLELAGPTCQAGGY